MAYFCDYQSDIGHISRLYRPNLSGINKNNNKFIVTADILSIISNWLSIDDYYFLKHKNSCSLSIVSRPRKVIYEDEKNLIQLDYPRPFSNIDWTSLNNSDIKLKVIGEKINDSTMKLRIRP